jgi:hypothetical protein
MIGSHCFTSALLFSCLVNDFSFFESILTNLNFSNIIRREETANNIDTHTRNAKKELVNRPFAMFENTAHVAATERQTPAEQEGLSRQTEDQERG